MQCKVLLISMPPNVNAAFDKPQAVIAEEPTHEGSPAEVELPRIGELCSLIFNTKPQAYTPLSSPIRIIFQDVELFFKCPAETGKDGSVVESSHGKKKGMVLPFEPHSITFDEVVYSVDMPQVNHIPCYWVCSSE